MPMTKQYFFPIGWQLSSTTLQHHYDGVDPPPDSNCYFPWQPLAGAVKRFLFTETPTEK